MKFPRLVRGSSPEDYLEQYQKQVIACWWNIVSLYSKAELTFDQRDKLVAINGLAKAIYDDYGQCIYGLWKYHLQDQLLWQKSYSKATKERDRLKFPTWSWASVDGNVYCQFLDNQKHNGNFCIVEIAEGKVEGDGAVKGAFLQVEADLFFGRFQKKIRAAEIFHSLNCDMCLGSNEETTGPVQCSCSSLELWYNNAEWDSFKNKDDGPVYGAIVKDREIRTGDESEIKGLLLPPCGASGGFTRVGKFHFGGQVLVDFPLDRKQRSLATQLCKDSEAYIASQPELYEKYILASQEHERPRFVFRIY